MTVALSWWIAFTVVAASALCVVSFLIVRDEVRLDLRHGVASARVAKVHHDGKGPGTARVAFLVGGKQYEATVQQPWFGQDLEPGEQASVEFLPSDPAVARRAGAHDVTSYAVVVVAIVLLCLAPLPLRRQARRS